MLWFIKRYSYNELKEQNQIHYQMLTQGMSGLCQGDPLYYGMFLIFERSNFVKNDNVILDFPEVTHSFQDRVNALTRGFSKTSNSQSEPPNTP